MKIQSNSLNLPESLEFRLFDTKRKAYVDQFEILINVTPGEATTIKAIPNDEAYFGDECMQQGWEDKHQRFIIEVCQKYKSAKINYKRLF